MIKNITKKTILADKIIPRSNILGKAVGLMFHKELDEDTAMIFFFKKEEIVSLHMLFVFFPIDVLYLNSEKNVVEIRENLKPFTLYSPKNKARYVIELSAGIIKKSKTVIGDRIEMN